MSILDQNQSQIFQQSCETFGAIVENIFSQVEDWGLAHQYFSRLSPDALGMSIGIKMAGNFSKLLSFRTFKKLNSLFLPATLYLQRGDTQHWNSLRSIYQNALSLKDPDEQNVEVLAAFEVIKYTFEVLDFALRFRDKFPHISDMRVYSLVSVLEHVEGAVKFENCVANDSRSLKLVIPNFFKKDADLELRATINRVYSSNYIRTQMQYYCYQTNNDNDIIEKLGSYFIANYLGACPIEEVEQTFYKLTQDGLIL